MMGRKRGFEFVVIFAFSLCFLVSSSQSHSLIANSNDDFDYFWFVQQWQPSYCHTFDPDLYNSCIESNNFFIYGFWPEFENGGYPLYCNGPQFDLDQLKKDDQLSLLKRYWPTPLGYPSKSTWKEAWKKHGVCAYKKQTDYFDEALTQIQKYDIKKILSDKGITPSHLREYRREYVRLVIRSELGKRPGFRCKNDFTTGRQMLTRVVLCMERESYELRDCPISADKECEDPAFIWPPEGRVGSVMPTDH